MSALYWVTYKDLNAPNLGQQVLSMGAADAKSIKRKDVAAANRNCMKRAKDRLKKKGMKPLIISVQCVG